mmetsp:Transcript_6307/g.7994  ORF Transcript_6307/g.7994 Transcript_6307/m.7994 type:complete len:318 (-) Transcript_6307:156-1109(-)
MSNNIVPAYLQRRQLNFADFTTVFKDLMKGNSGTIVTESAKFDEQKPDGLEVSDDTWASLTLRVDPLARAILDPHNLYLGSSLLVILISLVFIAVKPGFQKWDGDDDFAVDDDFNDKYNAEDDYWKYRDVENNQYSYENRALARQKILWSVLFALTISAAVGVTAIVSYMLENRNSRIDVFIYEICDEVAERFEQEGYEIEYKSRIVDEGVAGHFMPERAIVFYELGDEEIGRRTQNTGYAPPSGVVSMSEDSAPQRKSESSFGTINVMVPDGYMPGQVVNVMTPSGLPIMVAVPSGLQPGESFPVQIPAQMYRPRK